MLLFSVLIVATATGQKARLKSAKNLMDRKNYQAAVEIYLEILDKQDDAEAKMGIAECYRFLRNQHEMEYWYGQVVLLPQAPPESMFYYAQALHRNGKYDKAKEWCKRYIEYDPSNMSAQMLLKACNESKIKNLKAAGTLYKISPLKDLNTNLDEFAPTYYQGSSNIVFCTNRDRGSYSVKIDAKTGNPFTELFISKITPVDDCSNKVVKPKKFHAKLSSQYHDGPASFSEDGSVVYFTRNNMEGKGEDGLVRLKVYKADATGNGGWSSPQSLPFNSDEYSVMHPSLSTDQTMLFFASDMPGGFGKMDLYVSYLENGRWSPPVNLGPTVNTESDEVFPFIHEHPETKERTLYFASDGQIGLGGLDVFFSKEAFGSWSDPVNLGSPVNSEADDFGFVTNGKKTSGFFSSNREEGGMGGDDIYQFCKLSVEVEVLVFNKKDNTPLESADVFISCSPVESFTTDFEGKVHCELPLDKACDFAAEKQGFKPNSVRRGTEGLTAGNKLFVQIPLDMERVFDITGTVTDGYAKVPVAGATVNIITKCGTEEDKQQVFTDANGKYEFKEIREGCDCQVKVSKKGYTEAIVTFSTGDPNGDMRVITRDLVINCTDDPNCPKPGPIREPDPLCPGCMRECEGDIMVVKGPMGDVVARIKCPKGNCPCEKGDTIEINRDKLYSKNLVHIYYDFDDASIRPDAEKELKNLLEFMEKHPNSVILLTSHTDARGTKIYNKRLSNRRAESVIRYLFTNGIDKKRLKAKGMGEEVMVNNCYDGNECSEAEHQENRRTEFQVVGSTEKSKRPEKIKVNPCRNCPGTPDVEGEGSPEPIDENGGGSDTLGSGNKNGTGNGYIEFSKKQD